MNDPDVARGRTRTCAAARQPIAVDPTIGQLTAAERLLLAAYQHTAQTTRDRQRELVRRRTNVLVGVLTAVAAVIAVFDLSLLAGFGMR